MPLTPTEKIWMDGELVDWDQAKIHVLTHSLHYGLGVFEGIRAYATSQGPAVFRLTDHIARLFSGAHILGMKMPFSPEEMVEAVKTVVRVNGLDACYIRPIAYLGYGEMGLNPMLCSVNVSVACWPWGAYLGDEGIANGVRLKVSSWARHDSRAMPTAAKSTGMYINSSLAKVEAVMAGYDEAVMLTTDGQVSEGTGENILWCATAASSRRRPRASAPSRASRPTRCARSPAISATRWRRPTCGGRICTWRTRPG